MTTHEVRITNFHAAEDARTSTSPFAASSEVVSRHYTPEAAARAARRHRSATCTCGCVVVVDLAFEAAEARRLADYRAELEADRQHGITP